MKDAKSAIVTGAGLIGIEIAFALKKQGLNVILSEMLPQIVPRSLDKDMSDILVKYLEMEGINVVLGKPITKLIGDGKVEKACFGDEDLFLPALVVEAAVLDEIGVDVPQEPDAPGVELLDGAFEIGVELLVSLPVPPDLLAHNGPILPGPVLAPHAGDLGPRVQHGEGLGEDGLGAPLDGEDHALPAPVRDVLPVGDAVS